SWPDLHRPLRRRHPQGRLQICRAGPDARRRRARDPRLRRPGRLCGGGADRGRVRRLSCAAEGVRRRRRAGHPPVRPAGGSVRGLCGGQGRG
ncbi:TraG P-loop domain-containing protein, partial [Dysosmobacter welbionis]